MNKKELVNKIVECVGKAKTGYMRAYVTDFAQKCPYTMVCVLVYLDQTPHASYGFSKVSWPDEFDPEEGKRIAIRRAAKSIADEILSWWQK